MGLELPEGFVSVSSVQGAWENKISMQREVGTNAWGYE